MIIECLGRRGYQEVEVQLSPDRSQLFEKHANLRNVKNVLAIISNNGSAAIAFGVAQVLAQQGFKTGMLKYRLEAPRLESSKMLTPDATIEPISVDSIKCMSLELLGCTDSSPLMLTKLLLNTSWGALDFLLIDTSEENMKSATLMDLPFQGGIIVNKPI